ncbi:hypothetical protein [Crocosphaera sp. XPORK-15E]|uniref:hypothetical protein n=1 Tax=Crocosphaera sp. XPORK-15E TaxID=3110247 RepID=UPI002B1FF15D|nr:hypothetical protein [Crocosphaera sp. XPORK-15E]MEA5536276.1 hypothetical protein [Crocosphaera sp. XPORK-15E]
MDGIIENIAPGKRFLLCLDEFERLQEVIAVINSRAPLNFLRHIIQDRNTWTLLFSGSHTLDEIETYWSDYLINTRSVRISYLETSEAAELIKYPVPEFPDIYLPETVERIIYWTRCQPFLVQLLCSELVEYLNRTYGQNSLNIKATPNHVDAIFDQALSVGRPYFNELWTNTLNQEQREYIRKLVKGEDIAVKEYKKIENKLIEKEIIKREEDKISFQVPLIERSIKQKIQE